MDCNFVTRKTSHNNELIKRTDDREGWKAMIADVCNRPGTGCFMITDFKSEGNLIKVACIEVMW